MCVYHFFSSGSSFINFRLWLGSNSMTSRYLTQRELCCIIVLYTVLRQIFVPSSLHFTYNCGGIIPTPGIKHVKPSDFLQSLPHNPTDDAYTRILEWMLPSKWYRHDGLSMQSKQLGWKLLWKVFVYTFSNHLINHTLQKKPTHQNSTLSYLDITPFKTKLKNDNTTNFQFLKHDIYHLIISYTWTSSLLDIERLR